MFVLETALEASADPGDGAGGQGEVLFLCHFHVDRSEVLEKRGTAEGSAAHGDPADDSGLVSHADLTQFDPGIEFLRKLFHQFPEVHAAFCAELNGDQFAIESIMTVDQFHGQIQPFHELLCCPQGGFCPHAVFVGLALIHHGGFALNMGCFLTFGNISLAHAVLIVLLVLGIRLFHLFDHLTVIGIKIFLDHAVIARIQVQAVFGSGNIL